MMFSTIWRGREMFTCEMLLSACAEGCYKHFQGGRWVCCKCGE